MKNLFCLFLLFLTLGAQAETLFSVGDISETSQTLTFSDVDEASGNYVPNPGRNVFCIFENTDGSNAATVTITAQQTSKNVPGYGTLTKADITVSLAASETEIVGPFQSAYVNSSNQTVWATTGTAAASVQAACFRQDRI